jgi:hypothetical protein
MLILTHSVIYTAGEPFARFSSNLAAALWLSSVGYRMTCRLGGAMVFEAR